MKHRKALLIDLVIAVYIFCTVAADTGSVAMKLARLMLVGACAVKVFHDRELKVSRYVLRLLAFCCVAALSCIWAENVGFAASMSVTLLINAICICSLMNLIDHKQKRMDLALNCMMIAPVLLEIRVISIGGLFGFLDKRAVGSISGNTVGLCAAFGACYAIYDWMQGRYKKPYMLLFVINCLIAVLSASRKALLCLCIPLAILFVYHRNDSAQTRVRKCVCLAILAIVGLAAVMKIPFLYDLIGERIEGALAMLSGKMEQADASSESRALLISRGLEWFGEKPLLGHGIDNYRAVLVKHYPTWSIQAYAHNNFVELLVDTGVVGLIVYYWNYAAILRRGIKDRKTMTNAELLIFAMFLALLISEYALVSYFDKYVQVFLLMMWMLIMKEESERGCRLKLWEGKAWKNSESS